MPDTFNVSTERLDQFMGRIIPLLNERDRRLFAGSVVDLLGRGGMTYVRGATGLAKGTVRKGQKECQELECNPKARKTVKENQPIRQAGAGRKTVVEHNPTVMDEIHSQLDGHVIGNPENPLTWTTKSTYGLAEELKKKGIVISPKSVGRLLKADGFSLQQNRKYVEKGGKSEDRDEQFRLINERVKSFIQQGQPVISVDTKKKELVGNYKNNGSEYRPSGKPRLVNDHDFEGEGGRAAPYGVYDIANNEGFVNVGISADTAEFAAFSIRQWWDTMGKARYPNATKLMITADGGGSNSSRSRLWKLQLQKLADETGLEICMAHFPPGTSKWNKIEHRLFAQISRNWRGQPLETLQVIVSLISATTTNTGLTVKCQLDKNTYEKGIKVSDEEFEAINLIRDAWRGDWNYRIAPQAKR